MASRKVASLFPINEAPSNGSAEQVMRDTQELVIGLVGPVGSGVTKSAEILEEILKEKFNYKVNRIKVSDIIKSKNSIIGDKEIDDDISESDRIKKLQEKGNFLREKFSERILAEFCVEKIAIQRLEEKGYSEVNDNLVPQDRRVVHIIDSIKNPNEIELFNDVYQDMFWLIGVFAPEDVRRRRLIDKGASSRDIQNIFDIDENEDIAHGQKVRDSIEKSDFFIRNDDVNEDGLRKSLTRYLNILFSIGVVTPNLDESAMYTAASAAATSGCLSRQVGAAIYSASGELIGKGANDVPKAGGGLYIVEDDDSDHRCYKWRNGKCHNDDRKEKLYKEIEKILKKEDIVPKSTPYAKIKSSLKNTDIKNLIEFSRAVHAEMEAIISVARSSKLGLVGSTMYSTTFPCHNCARHIVAAGVARLMYIEPYPKSLALTLHDDAISTKSRDEKARVEFLQYEGVAPKNFLRLFRQIAKRKNDGMIIKQNPHTAYPRSRYPLDGFDSREQFIVELVRRRGASIDAPIRG